MIEFLIKQDPEQLMLGGVLALIEEYGLEFNAGYFEYDDIDDIVGAVAGALYEIGEGGHELLKEYGAIEEYEV